MNPADARDESTAPRPAGGEALLGRTRSELETLARELGQPAYRGRQLAHWLYAKGVRDWSAMSDLPAGLREELAERFSIGRNRVAAEQRSSDGTVKVLLQLADGRGVETVVLPWPDRLSVCISSQTGCAVGCTFCATGYLGAGRNLDAGEITDQLLTAREIAGRDVTNVVFMGMGEPLLNLDAVLASIELWRDELDFSPRRVTVSTVGLPPQMERLADADLPVTLALSLHAADDRLRGELIPTVGRRWSVAEVVAAARHYADSTGRRVTYEIALLHGVNDRPADAHRLAERLRPGDHVNLIPFNPIPEAPFGRPSRERIAAFREVLEQAGLAVTQRQTRGQDIAGACGQLQARASGEDLESPVTES